MKKLWCRSFFLVFLLFFITIGCISSDSPDKNQGDKLDTVKVRGMPFISFSPLFIAEEEGYFAEQGINVEFVKSLRSGESITLLSQGELDVGAGGASASLFNAISKGLTIKLVADKGHIDDKCDYVALTVRKDLYESGEITKIAHLKGKKIAFDEFSIWHTLYYSDLLNQEGLTLEDIEIVNLRPPEMVEALQTKAIDAADFGEPYITRTSDMGISEKLAGYNEILPSFNFAYIIYGPNLIENNPDLGRRFMIAYLKAVRQYNEGKTDRNIDIIQRYTELDRDLIERACWPPIFSSGSLDPQSLLEVQKWGYDNGYVDELVTEDQLFDLRFAEYAHGILS